MEKPEEIRTVRTMSHSHVLGFDADDTLWHNENIFEAVHARYRDLLSRYHDGETVERTLFATEMKNLELYGYGVKGFTLSAIETAIELTQGSISAEEIRRLIALGQEMLAHPVELLEGVAETLELLAGQGFRLVGITKGDLRDQERKLAKSGLAARFECFEIVSEKDERAYRRLLQRLGAEPQRFLMVGNSLKSDILPVLALGGAGVHIPYRITWAHERVEQLPTAPGRFYSLAQMKALPAVVADWASRC